MHTRFRATLGVRVGLIAAAVPLTIASVGVSCSSSSSTPGTIGDTQGTDASNTPDTTTPDTGSTMHDSAADSTGDVVSGEGGLEGGVTCEGGGQVCGGVCTDTQTDPNNCGTCSHGCGMSVGMVCVGGQCGCNVDAGLAICGLNCVDTQTDSTNCGSCGHDCQGSTCMGGFCLPTVAAQSSTPIWDIAVTPDSLYWTQSGINGTISQKPFGSGTQVLTVFTGLNDPRGITVDLINVYWANYGVTGGPGGVDQAQVIGGPLINDWPTAAQIDAGSPPGNDEPLALASDGSTIFWVSYFDGMIQSLPIGNPSGVNPNILYGKAKHPVAIAVDGANVYWADQGSAVPPSFNGCIYQINKNVTNGTPTKLTPLCDEQNPNDITIDDNNVYWVDLQNPGSVKMVPIGGGTIVTLASSEGGPYGIATLQSDPNVYWTDEDDNTVKSIAKSGDAGAPTVLALGQQSPRAIVIDQKNVYWVNFQANAIYEVSK